MAMIIKDFLDSRYINIIGGCCGTTPEHIQAIAELVKTAIPKEIAGLQTHFH